MILSSEISPKYLARRKELMLAFRRGLRLVSARTAFGDASELDARNQTRAKFLIIKTMKEVIELSKSNYKDYLLMDLVAFSFAAPGAMGYAGRIVIVGKDAQTYFFNYVRGDLTMEEVYEILPILKECNFGIFGGGKYPEGWSEMYMGFGNHLVVHQSILPKVEQETKSIQSPPELYQRWHDIVVGAISNKEQ